MLPRCVLSSPANGDRLRWREILQLVRGRIRRWKSGDVMGLWSDHLANEVIRAKRHRGRKSPDTVRSSNVRRAKRAIEAGQFRKAIQALTSDGLATPSCEIFPEMLAKHPQSPLPPSLSSPPPPSISFTGAQVLHALRSFPSDSAPGPSRLSAIHLKEAVFCPSPERGDKVLQAITATVNLLSAGRAPPDVIPHLCGASLLASKKSGGGHRPIAVGEVLRRLVSKCLSRAVHSVANHYLTPLQVGVGVRAGCEAIVHAVSRTLDDPVIPPDSRCALLLDFSNAFNSIDRALMFREVRAHIPALSAWVESCYGAQPRLLFGEHVILSRCGVQQGDPLGPLLFALTLHPIVERIHQEVRELRINVWYLDDGTLCGPPEALFQALKIVEEDGPAGGLRLNRAKSLLFIPDDVVSSCDCLPPDVPITRSGFCLLGIPIGPPEFCESSTLRRVEKIRMAVSRLHDLEDSQMETTLLRSCLSLPKFNFALRTCPPSAIQVSTAAFDNLMRDSLSDLAGGPVSDWSWLKASLPSSFGGLNVPSCMLLLLLSVLWTSLVHL